MDLERGSRSPFAFICDRAVTFSFLGCCPVPIEDWGWESGGEGEMVMELAAPYFMRVTLLFGDFSHPEGSV